MTESNQLLVNFEFENHGDYHLLGEEEEGKIRHPVTYLRPPIVE